PPSLFESADADQARPPPVQCAKASFTRAIAFFRDLPAAARIEGGTSLRYEGRASVTRPSLGLWACHPTHATSGNTQVASHLSGGPSNIGELSYRRHTPLSPQTRVSG